MEPGEWGPKQPGNQEQDAKMTKEQGAEEINLGSMEHRVCHGVLKLLDEMPRILCSLLPKILSIVPCSLVFLTPYYLLHKLFYPILPAP